MLDTHPSSAAPPVSIRELTPPPSEVIDPQTRLPRAGSFEGPLPPIDYRLLGQPLPLRIAREKAWYYVAISTPEIFFGAAMLRFGYVASSFAFLFQRGVPSAPSGHFLADRSQLAPPFAATYRGDEGISFRLFKKHLRFERSAPDGAFELEVAWDDLRANARISGALVPPPLSAVADLGAGLVQATEKRALLNVSGEVEVMGRRFSLDGGFAGFDRSHGYLARHTAWRWAFAQGIAESGERIALNLVDGFVGEAECVVWLEDKVIPVGEGRFQFDLYRPLSDWRVRTTCGSVDLVFEPGDIHSEHQNLGLVKTQFIQPVGAFSGTITVMGRTYKVNRILGVVESQDAVW